jgi:hypothetical protein
LTIAASPLVLATIAFHRRHADLFDEQLSLLAVPLSVAESRHIAGIAAAQDRNAAVARITNHLKRGVELRPQAIVHSLAEAPPDNQKIPINARIPFNDVERWAT